MTSKPSWTFQETPRMGGATGEAYTNTLFGTGMSPASVLAREAIQNSSDASSGRKKVSVAFRRVTLTNESKKRFVSVLNLQDELKGRKSKLELQQGNCLQGMTSPSVPLELLYIEDCNTHGLYGDPHDPSSHFFRLLLSLGDGSKSREKEGSGGSYGYGKSVYSANSRIHTIVAYSVFEPKDDQSKHYARLMGCGYFNAHDHHGKNYTGRAWFGIPSAKYEGDVDPLHDDAAQEMAAELGFTSRDRKDSGTSILVVDCPVDCEDIRSSVEDWWWPRLIEDGLDVSLFEQTKRLEPPRPRKRTHLRPFITCYDMAVGRAEPLGPQHKTASLNRMPNGVMPGTFGFAIVDEDELADEALQDLVRTVALVRAPRMVVSYFQVGGGLPLPCVGTFVATEDADKPLKMSEPASHDKWDPRSARLNNLSEDERSVVEVVLSRLKTAMRKFSSDAAPATPKQDLRLKSLERLLGSIFRPPTLTPGGNGGHKADPIQISFVRAPAPVAEDDGIRTQGSFRVSLAEDADRRFVDAVIEVECLVIEDEGVSREDPIEMSLDSKDVDFKRVDGCRNKVVVRLERDSTPLFSFRSGKYPFDWTTSVRIKFEEAPSGD